MADEADLNGNTNIFVSGTETASNISKTHDSIIQAKSSKVVVHNSTNIDLQLTYSDVFLSHTSNFTAIGLRNQILGDRLTKGKVEGDRNVINAESTSNLILTGNQTQCELLQEVDPTINGNDNVIYASNNVKLEVRGSGNQVVAANNANLKVLGERSKVVASRTSNISVKGDTNQVSVIDTTVSHQLQRITPGSPHGNQVDFSGSPFNCCVYAGIVFPSLQPQASMIALNGDGSRTTLTGCSDQIHGSLMDCFPGETEPLSTEDLEPVVEDNPLPSLSPSSVRLVVPQVNICYLDRAAIKRNSYVVGIFYFQVESVQFGGAESYSSWVKVEVDMEELDGGSYSSEMGETEDHAIIKGKKDGAEQTLNVTGRRVSRLVNPDGREVENAFLIDLNLI